MLRNKKGFTLVELLVVIAIIGILSSVVLVSLNSARAKARDARRISDIRAIQVALESYYDATGSAYPTAITDALLGAYFSGGKVPIDPSGGSYVYAGLQGTAAAAATCGSYHLAAKLEQSNPALNSDADAASATICTGGGTDFSGADATDCSTGTVLKCYDVKP